MQVKKYNKLVRDRVPEICLRNKSIPKTRMARDDREFIFYLQKKIKEETAEIIKEKDKEKLKREVANLFEALDTLLKTLGVSKSEILKARREKNRERGTFKKRIILLETKSNLR